jgi:hypothetical protein
MSVNPFPIRDSQWQNKSPRRDWRNLQRSNFFPFNNLYRCSKQTDGVVYAKKKKGVKKYHSEIISSSAKISLL